MSCFFGICQSPATSGVFWLYFFLNFYSYFFFIPFEEAISLFCSLPLNHQKEWTHTCSLILLAGCERNFCRLHVFMWTRFRTTRGNQTQETAFITKQKTNKQKIGSQSRPILTVYPPLFSLFPLRLEKERGSKRARKREREKQRNEQSGARMVQRLHPVLLR